MTTAPSPLEGAAARSWRRGALAVILLALALRVSLIPFHGFDPGRVAVVDSEAYLELARTLREEGEFARGSGPETFRTPGYPVLLAAASYLPGPTTVWIVWIQVLLDLVVVAAALILGRRWCSPAAGIVAGMVLAVDPGHVVGSHLVMADVAAAAAVAAAFLLGERGGAVRAGLAGALISAAIALRPATLLLVLPLAIRLGARAAGRRAVAVAVTAALLFPAAWTFRNGHAAGRWSLSTAFELNLGLVAAAKIVSRGEGVTLEEARRRLAERGAVLDPAGQVGRNRRVFAAQAAAHPVAALSEAALSAAEMLLAGERRHALQLFGVEGASRREASIGEAARGASVRAALSARAPGVLLLVGAQLLVNAGILLLAVVGAIALARCGRKVELLTALLCLTLVLGPSLVVASARMRVPVSLFLAVLAGAGAGAIAGGAGRCDRAGRYT